MRDQVWAFAIVTALAVGGISGVAWGQTAGQTASSQPVKIGYVDVGKVFDGYQRTKASDAVLQQKGKQKEAELEGRLNELKKLRQNLELLNADAREAKEREVEEKAEALRQFRTRSARELRRERDKVARGILEEIRRGIEGYASANGFTLILDERSLVYGQTVDDLTDEVLQVLNARTAPPKP